MPSDKSVESIQPIDAKRTWKEKTKILFIIYSGLFGAFLLFLSIIYLFIGDKTVFGEYITVWPPILWIFILIPFSLMFLIFGRYTYCGYAIIGIAIFLLLTEEWHSLFRVSGNHPPTPQQSVSNSTKIPLRIIVWNVNGAGGKKLLSTLESYQPDICLLSEAPNLDIKSISSTGYWKGFRWIYAGDCGTLSRYPIQELPSSSIGPWSAPQMMNMELPNHRQVLLANVRLMLPSLLFNIFDRNTRNQFIETHQTRIKQYQLLSQLITNSNQKNIILVGDFNISARSKSLNPLRKILRDAWLEGGHGWGRTMTIDFPVSRIDQCWISQPIICVYGKVVPEPLSDHRLLFIELAI
jgi:endonuclease/exonuclease/phosphatase (EEP) superfamily protein YafD